MQDILRDRSEANEKSEILVRDRVLNKESLLHPCQGVQSDFGICYLQNVAMFYVLLGLKVVQALAGNRARKQIKNKRNNNNKEK